MRAKSVRTSIVDPYRAGLCLGLALTEIHPEIVFLFTTEQYGQTGQFIDGLYDGLGNQNVRVIGATGDGIYECEGAVDVGAVALGIESGGKIAWHVESSSGVSIDPESAVRRTLAKLDAVMDGNTPSLYFVVSDAQADGSRIEAVIRDECPVPVIGGMAGHDNGKLSCGYQYKDRSVLRDSVVLAAADGMLSFQVHACNSFVTTGEVGVIDSASGGLIQRVSGLDAMTFIERQLGKPVLAADQGIALAASVPKFSGEKRLRAFRQDSAVDRTIMLRGSIAAGESVQLCTVNTESLRNDMRTLSNHLRESQFEPEIALVVSCSGRRWLSAANVDLDLEEVRRAIGKSIPLAGFLSFGEFSPLSNEGLLTRNLFHNMTFVLLLFGR